MEVLYIFCAIFLMGFVFSEGNGEPLEDKQALLDFITKLPHSRSLNWNQTTPVCTNWTGVACSPDGSRVVSVRLPGVGFHGPIPANTLSRVSSLQILSLRSNGITGHFPSDFTKLKNLSYLYLQLNDLSGPLPSDFSAWNNLTVVNLSNNRFNGSIPKSVSNLTHLAALNLANNLLSGNIPDLDLPNLVQLNLTNNDLIGIVPKSLQRFPSSMFSGNNVSSPNFPHLPKSKKGSRFGENALLWIVIAGSVLGVIGFAFLMIVCCSRRKGEEPFSQKLDKVEKSVSRTIDANNRLSFFEGCDYAFDLEDLLRASAEVLGKGTFGTAYKAILEDGSSVVVKRLKEVSAGKREFEQQMEVVGGVRHENVAELKAYYYSKDEKLLVYGYFVQGSVSAMLHGNRGGGDRVPLDWDTRLKIAIGAARGIARIHTEHNSKLVHGNIKSTNIFLNPQNYGCVSDLGLTPIMSPLSPPISRAAGYRAPEVTDTRKTAQPSDVYSFGVVLLELLTGKSPVHTTRGDEMVHLVRWVSSVVREEWTAEVFDLELMRYVDVEEEMVEVLQIAMACVVRVPEQRPRMSEVVTMVENVRPALS